MTQKKVKIISYPSRVEASLVARVNKKRKEQGISWPALTRKLLKLYLRTRTENIL